jgi:hypothetical protein
MLRVPSERATTEAFLSGIGLAGPQICMLDPVIVCDHLWQKWQTLANSIMSSSQHVVHAFIEKNK